MGKLVKPIPMRTLHEGTNPMTDAEFRAEVERRDKARRDKARLARARKTGAPPNEGGKS